MSLQMKRRRNLTWVGAAGLGFLALLALACDTDSPTEPQQVPAPFPSGGSGARWNISLNISPSSQIVGGTAPSTISIRVTRAGGGDPQVPVNGTAAAVTTTLGELNTVGVPGSGQNTLAVGLVNGRADIYFFPGASAGEALVTAQVERDVGQRSIQIRADELFITGLTPNSGPQGGGTRVRIEGVGFAEPLQVLFGDSPGSNVDVGSQGKTIRVNTPRVLDPESFFDTEACDGDGDGVEDGLRMLPTAVAVTVQLSSGGSGTFPNGFVYNPGNNSCVESPDPVPDPSPFISGVSPNSGPAGPGQPQVPFPTTVTISGRDFVGSVRVLFASSPATVLSKTRTTIVADTPVGTLTTESCDDIPAPDPAGIRQFDTPVSVTVELFSGQSDTLADAFIYLAPFSGACCDPAGLPGACVPR